MAKKTKYKEVSEKPTEETKSDNVVTEDVDMKQETVVSEPKSTVKKDDVKKSKPIPKPAPKPAPKPSPLDIQRKLLNDYLTRYKSSQERFNHQQMIMNFYKVYTTVEKYPYLLGDTVQYFKKNRNLLRETTAMRGIDEYLDNVKKVKLSVFYYMVKMGVSNKKERISFDLVKNVIPDGLFNAYQKLLATIR